MNNLELSAYNRGMEEVYQILTEIERKYQQASYDMPEFSKGFDEVAGTCGRFCIEIREELNRIV